MSSIVQPFNHEKSNVFNTINTRSRTDRRAGILNGIRDKSEYVRDGIGIIDITEFSPPPLLSLSPITGRLFVQILKILFFIYHAMARERYEMIVKGRNRKADR